MSGGHHRYVWNILILAMDLYLSILVREKTGKIEAACEEEVTEGGEEDEAEAEGAEMTMTVIIAGMITAVKVKVKTVITGIVADMTMIEEVDKDLDNRVDTEEIDTGITTIIADMAEFLLLLIAVVQMDMVDLLLATTVLVAMVVHHHHHLQQL